ncbi:MAG: HD-GYP domain-containing protein, partial [Burkholderiales bacterium]
QHHERLDGSGYPRGLKGDAISLFGRMAAIADCYTGLISPRAYAMASSPHEAMTSLCEWAGVSFDGPLVEQFIQAMTAWPAGSLVELDSGEVAVVMTPVRAAGERMLVQVLLNVDKDPLAQPELRRISAQGESGSPVSGRTLLGSLTAGAYGIRLSRWADALLAH